MDPRQIVTLTALLMLLAWSVVMTAIGYVAAIAPLAPILVLTVHQVNQGNRSSRPRLLRHRTALRSTGEDDAP